MVYNIQIYESTSPISSPRSTGISKVSSPWWSSVPNLLHATKLFLQVVQEPSHLRTFLESGKQTQIASKKPSNKTMYVYTYLILYIYIDACKYSNI